MIVVVDASVAVKWFVPEPLNEIAGRLLASSHDLVAPELIRIEVASAFLKALRRGAIEADEARDAIARLSPPSIRLEQIAPYIDEAFAIAARLGGSVYDAIYILLASELGAVVATNDSELARTARTAGVQAWHLAEPPPSSLEL